ncbi:MAG: hypothetical protein JOY71_12530 [Acetobacteraceae bacterium]|nr:hypothetical protein [Acetobacteraceae bacterium]
MEPDAARHFVHDVKDRIGWRPYYPATEATAGGDPGHPRGLDLLVRDSLEFGPCEQGVDDVGIVQGARRPCAQIPKIQVDPVVEQGDQLRWIRLHPQGTRDYPLFELVSDDLLRFRRHATRSVPVWIPPAGFLSPQDGAERGLTLAGLRASKRILAVETATESGLGTGLLVAADNTGWAARPARAEGNQRSAES